MSTFNLSGGVVYHYFSCAKHPLNATLKVSERSYKLRDQHRRSWDSKANFEPASNQAVAGAEDFPKNESVI